MNLNLKEVHFQKNFHNPGSMTTLRATMHGRYIYGCSPDVGDELGSVLGVAPLPGVDQVDAVLAVTLEDLVRLEDVLWMEDKGWTFETCGKDSVGCTLG